MKAAVLNDRQIAELAFLNRSKTESTVFVSICTLMMSPLNVFLYGVSPEQMGVVLWMHIVLAIVASCIMTPLSWAREEVFMRTPALVHRFGHFVLRDEMEERLEKLWEPQGELSPL
jgi:hypothetical protein